MSAVVPRFEQMLAALISTPSVSCVNPVLDQSNRPLVALLAEWAEAAGFRVEVMTIPGHPDKANLMATLGQGDDGLVLAGHTDTVPFDESHWSHDPLRLTEVDGRYYGLGIADMKAFFALALEAARGLRAAELRAPLILLATADEESAMNGARALVAAGRRPGRHALIGEPTGLRPVRLHKGVMNESLRLVGRSGHASDPALGNSALEGMHEVIGAVLAWREGLRQGHRHPAFAIPYPTVNLGHIHGGDNPNRICGECELQLDLRLLPGMSAERVRAALCEQVAEIADRRGLRWAVEPLFEAIPPAETAAEAAIVRACERLTGRAAEAVNFGTEAPFLNQLGMETVVLGPGDIAQAHQPDEFLALERIPPTLALLRGLIGEFCVK
ncbi:acetylornithine deacetylase [Marichromatium bheemlicum]|uniref:Acetylornithine deacetylase n=1 Tax=Marichromatium bheemlicum TaxID=365339 RepID=A0ABX1I5J7_9GAMM|nr:acetylornithine deacetylase [Marichromatium bheemlicum]NKN32855.1 acetylornithine deacetylase [Marichromatium bheemlicum]